MAYNRLIDHTEVTADNLADAQEACVACDQSAELVPGCITWGIVYDGEQRGQMTRWPSDRGAVCLGGGSSWGDWDGDRLVLDDPDEHGNAVCYDAYGVESHRQA